MKCPQCFGAGVIDYPIDYEKGLFDEKFCSMCNGSGEVQTNYEWLQTCTMEEMAKAFKNELFIKPILLEMCMKAMQDVGYMSRIKVAEQVILEWLKEKHD